MVEQSSLGGLHNIDATMRWRVWPAQVCLLGVRSIHPCPLWIPRPENIGELRALQRVRMVLWRCPPARCLRLATLLPNNHLASVAAA